MKQIIPWIIYNFVQLIVSNNEIAALLRLTFDRLPLQRRHLEEDLCHHTSPSPWRESQSGRWLTPPKLLHLLSHWSADKTDGWTSYSISECTYNFNQYAHHILNAVVQKRAYHLWTNKSCRVYIESPARDTLCRCVVGDDSRGWEEWTQGYVPARITPDNVDNICGNILHAFN